VPTASGALATVKNRWGTMRSRSSLASVGFPHGRWFSARKGVTRIDGVGVFDPVSPIHCYGIFLPRAGLALVIRLTVVERWWLCARQSTVGLSNNLPKRIPRECLEGRLQESNIQNRLPIRQQLVDI
jgi:hypothetical protein